MKPDHDEPALRGQAANALVEPLPANWVEDGVDAEAVVLRTKRGDPVALGVEDPVRAGPFGDVHLVRAGGDGDHLGAEPTGHLHRGGADAAGRSVDRDALAAADPSPAGKGEMRGVVVHDEAGGRFHAQPLRDPERQRRFGQGHIGKAAEHGEGHDTVARL